MRFFVLARRIWQTAQALYWRIIFEKGLVKEPFFEQQGIWPFCQSRALSNQVLGQDEFLNEICWLVEYMHKAEEKYFIIDNDNGIVKLKQDDIIYFDSAVHIIIAYTLDKVYAVRDILGALMEEYGKHAFIGLTATFQLR